MKLTKADLTKQVSQLEDEVRRLKRDVSHLQLDLSPMEYASRTFETKLQPNEHVKDAINRASSEWDLNVTEPGLGGDSSRINLYIKSMDGIGWSWEDDYTHNGQFAWCGAFASWCYTDVKQPIRTKIFPSCYRMYKAWSNTSRRIDPMKVQPGDIVVIYTSKRSVQGDHITLCVDTSNINEGYINTIEGNAKGTLGNGEYGEGVIKQERTLDKIAHVYRLLGEDFNE